MNSLREQRKEIFDDTKQLYENDKKLIDSIKNSKKQQKIIADEKNVSSNEFGRYDTPVKVVVSKKRTLEAAMGYSDSKVCVLNFASATNPGGGVVNGMNAQEEAICRCSTLFPCISDTKIREQFYQKHRILLRSGQLNALYNDDCIYTPGVTVFKADIDTPKLLPEDKWYQVDVITCAAPNLRNKPGNAMNPDSGNKAVSIQQNDLLELHMKRIRKILAVAKENKAEVLILGAFGCGVFKNPPELVAEAMARILEEYCYEFKVVEFAVYCNSEDTKNYTAFKEKFIG